MPAVVAEDIVFSGSQVDRSGGEGGPGEVWEIGLRDSLVVDEDLPLVRRILSPGRPTIRLTSELYLPVGSGNVTMSPRWNSLEKGCGHIKSSPLKLGSIEPVLRRVP